MASCSCGSNGRPGSASMGVTPSLSSRSRSLRSMAAMPSNQGSSATDAGRASMARSKSSATAKTLRIRSSPASPSSRIRSSLVRRLKFWNSARSRWRADRYSSVVRIASSRSVVRASIWPSRAVGEMSISSARSSARVRGRSGIQVIHQFVHEAGHETDRADGLGIGHPGRPQDTDDADRPSGPAIRCEDERDVTHLEGLVLVTDEDLDAARAGDAADELAQVGTVLESVEDAAELVALGELGCFHHVEQAVAEDLLDRLGVVLADDLDDTVPDPPGEGVDPVVGVERGDARLGAACGHVDEALVEPCRDRVERGLVDGVVAVDGDQCLLDRTLAQDEDQAGHPFIDGNQVDPADVRIARLGRRGQPGGSRHGCESRRGETEPVLAGELDLAELVADHELLDGRQRDGLHDRFDVEAIAGVGGDATGGGVRVRQKAVRLELGQDAAHRRAGHAEAIALDERLAADRRSGRDVFLDDGPKDRLRAKVQGAEWAAWWSRETRSPTMVSTR